MSKLIRSIGLMSGTSIDGIDVALIETDGMDVIRRLGGRSYAYGQEFRARLKAGLGDAAAIVERTERPGDLARLEHDLTLLHAEAVAQFRDDAGIGHLEIEIVGFHGQTVLHRPDAALTVQLGDGALLAERTGIPVVFDMRAADVAAGGQGAPLAPAYHRAMAAGYEGATAVLNIGGVANVTFIGADGMLMAFDTGPGNALLDDWIAGRSTGAFDRDGAVSAAGRADEAIVAAWLSRPFFQNPPPKSLDRNSFDIDEIQDKSLEDGAATLAAFTTAAVALAGRWLPTLPRRWIVTGGGRRNPTIMRELGRRLGAPVMAAEDAGFDGDLVEAEAWAYLAVRSLRGLALSYPGTTGVPQPLTGGRTAHPTGATRDAG